jgi:hypothetical protein
MRGTLKSKKFWIGALAGTIAGGWFLGQVSRISGVNIGLPSAGGSG